MLIDFFFTLKDAKIPVSIKEFLTLLEALQKNVIDASMDDFYYLSRLTLVKVAEPTPNPLFQIVSARGVV